MMFRRPLVDTRPLALLIVVLWFSRCLLRLESSAVIGAWSSRVRVLYTLWAARYGHVSYLLLYLVVSEGFFF
jgi:hypothetical protein